MELFLNFVWIMVSLLLIVHWARSAKPISARQFGKAAVALLLISVVLLPVISATDDLIANTSLLENEHGEHTVRRGEMPLWGMAQGSSTPIDLAVFAILFIDLAFLSTLLTRLASRKKVFRLLDGFGKTVSIRPPPMAVLIAA